MNLWPVTAAVNYNIIEPIKTWHMSKMLQSIEKWKLAGLKIALALHLTGWENVVIFKQSQN